MNPTDRDFIRTNLEALYASLRVAPTGRGTGATDIEYYIDEVALSVDQEGNKGWSGGNIGYWTDKITHDVQTSAVPTIPDVPAVPPTIPASDGATYADLSTAVATISTLIDASEARIIARIDKFQNDANAFLKSVAPYFPQVQK